MFQNELSNALAEWFFQFFPPQGIKRKIRFSRHFSKSADFSTIHFAYPVPYEGELLETEDRDGFILTFYYRPGEIRTTCDEVFSRMLTHGDNRNTIGIGQHHRYSGVFINEGDVHFQEGAKITITSQHENQTDILIL